MVLLVEALSLTFLYTKYKFLSYPQGYREIAFNELFIVTNNSNKDGCPNFSDLLGPHPFMGYSLRTDGPCADENGDGFNGNKIPITRNDEFFDVLVVGGSVASQIAKYEDIGGSPYLEEKLNSLFEKTMGKKLRVFSMAMGDYSYPHQLIALGLSTNWVDGYIDIFGLNDSYELVDSFTGNPKIRISSNYYGVMGDFTLQAQKKFRKNIYNFIMTYKPFSWLDSSYFFTVVDAQIFEFSKRITNDKSFKRETLSSLNFQEELSPKQMIEIRRDQMKSNLMSMKSLSLGHGLKGLHIFQPILASKDSHNKKEIATLKKYYSERAEGFKKSYLFLGEDYKSFSKDHEISFSNFAQFFDGEFDIYQDDCHFDLDDKSENAPIRRLIDKIALEAFEQWN